MARIGIDIDEVLAETVQGFLSFYNAKHSTNHQLSDISDYSFGKQFGLTPAEEMQSIKEFFVSEYFPKLTTVEGSVSAIKELANNHELFAISSRSEQLLAETRVWLGLHFNNCFKEIILTDSHFDASRTKSSVCRSMDLTIFIEDQLRFAEDCAQVCLAVYLLDKPWNQAEIIVSDKIIRVKTWRDIVERINNV